MTSILDVLYRPEDRNPAAVSRTAEHNFHSPETDMGFEVASEYAWQMLADSRG